MSQCFSGIIRIFQIHYAIQGPLSTCSFHLKSLHLLSPKDGVNRSLAKSATCPECSQQLSTNPGNVWPSVHNDWLAYEQRYNRLPGNPQVAPPREAGRSTAELIPSLLQSQCPH